MNNKYFLLTIIIIMLSSCVTISASKTSRLISIDKKEIEVYLELPTGEWYSSSGHTGLIRARVEYSRNYIIKVKNQERKYKKGEFEIFIITDSETGRIRKTVSVLSGYIQLLIKHKGYCKVIVNIQPDDQQHNILNDVYLVHGCGSILPKTNC